MLKSLKLNGGKICWKWNQNVCMPEDIGDRWSLATSQISFTATTQLHWMCSSWFLTRRNELCTHLSPFHRFLSQNSLISQSQKTKTFFPFFFFLPQYNIIQSNFSLLAALHQTQKTHQKSSLFTICCSDSHPPISMHSHANILKQNLILFNKCLTVYFSCFAWKSHPKKKKKKI